MTPKRSRSQRGRKWMMFARVSRKVGEPGFEIADTARGFWGKTRRHEQIIRVEIRELRTPHAKAK